MKRVNQNDLPWREGRSPRGKYHKFRRNLSGAFAADTAGPPLPGPAPFDVELVRLPPGAAHQLVNDGEGDLLYYVIANNAASDVWHHPDSDKWGFALPNGDDTYFRKSEVDYYDGEE